VNHVERLEGILTYIDSVKEALALDIPTYGKELACFEWSTDRILPRLALHDVSNKFSGVGSHRSWYKNDSLVNYFEQLMTGGAELLLEPRPSRVTQAHKNELYAHQAGDMPLRFGVLFPYSIEDYKRYRSKQGGAASPAMCFPDARSAAVVVSKNIPESDQQAAMRVVIKNDPQAAGLVGTVLLQQELLRLQEACRFRMALGLQAENELTDDTSLLDYGDLIDRELLNFLQETKEATQALYKKEKKLYPDQFDVLPNGIHSIYKAFHHDNLGMKRDSLAVGRALIEATGVETTPEVKMLLEEVKSESLPKIEVVESGMSPTDQAFLEENLAKRIETPRQEK
jgi:hypothetical protein